MALDSDGSISVDHLAAVHVAESLACCVCLDADKDTVLLPCRHLCVCSDCSLELRSCPLCRARVRHRVKVYTGICHLDADTHSEPPSVAGDSCGGGACRAATPPSSGRGSRLCCPLHGEQCAAMPFKDRAALDQHCGAALDSAGAAAAAVTALGSGMGSDHYAVADQAVWAAAHALVPPAAVTVTMAGSEQRESSFGPWHSRYREYGFVIHIENAGAYTVSARYSALLRLSETLGRLNPPVFFPKRDSLAWLGGSADDERVQRRHAELRDWLQALFAPRAVVPRGGALRGLHDAAGVLASPVVHRSLRLSRQCIADLMVVAERRRAWFAAACRVLGNYGVVCGSIMRRAVQPGSGVRLQD
eukprot:TRINITY_DN1595_c1_g1_i1.p1 TRINITY_DN1595_c1_g1~~TRINITY_DN1595_c1_g1_i1.p1  ORF type:complete len:360 (+),score=99.58 TRINITY_DN1595_c1_g1_i1:117-1196(+)